MWPLRNFLKLSILNLFVLTLVTLVFFRPVKAFFIPSIGSICFLWRDEQRHLNLHRTQVSSVISRHSLLRPHASLKLEGDNQKTVLVTTGRVINRHSLYTLKLDISKSFLLKEIKQHQLDAGQRQSISTSISTFLFFEQNNPSPTAMDTFSSTKTFAIFKTRSFFRCEECHCLSVFDKYWYWHRLPRFTSASLWPPVLWEAWSQVDHPKPRVLTTRYAPPCP